MNLKMSLKKLNHLFLGIVFLVQILALPIAQHNLVLCIGDNHVALEQKNVLDDCNHDAPQGTSKLKMQSIYHTDNCVDIPLHQHARYVVIKKHHHAIHFDPLVLITKNIPPACPQTSFYVATFTSLSFPLQNAVRTVVLLI